MDVEMWRMTPLYAPALRPGFAQGHALRARSPLARVFDGQECRMELLGAAKVSELCGEVVGGEAQSTKRRKRAAFMKTTRGCEG